MFRFVFELGNVIWKSSSGVFTVISYYLLGDFCRAATPGAESSSLGEGVLPGPCPLHMSQSPTPGPRCRGPPAWGNVTACWKAVGVGGGTPPPAFLTQETGTSALKSAGLTSSRWWLLLVWAALWESTLHHSFCSYSWSQTLLVSPISCA